jgi:hypothetical protein
MKELKDIISDIDESVWRILSNDFNLMTNVILEPDILINEKMRDFFKIKLKLPELPRWCCHLLLLFVLSTIRLVHLYIVIVTVT